MPEARRFAYVLEFSRQKEYQGTPEQQTAIRDWMAARLELDNTFDRTMWTLAKIAKTSVPFIDIKFVPGVSAHGSWFGMSISDQATGEEMLTAFAHELGHIVGLNFLYDRSEGWAEMFKGWAWNGAPQQVEGDITHAVWERIGPVVARYAPGRP